MKRIILAAFALAALIAHAAQPPSESSPVPIRWTVETSRAQVAQFDAYRGETLDLEATMKSYGSPLAAPVQPSLYWQTNGMGAAWWTSPATASGNVLRATWSPTNDCGGTVYNCFIGQAGGNYRAAFRLRMLPSPGYTPNHLPLPTVTGESDPVFSAWLATNELFSACVGTNAVKDLITSATNGLATAADLAGHVPARAETVGTERIWTDATGVVWRAVFDPILDYWTIKWFGGLSKPEHVERMNISVFWDGSNWVIKYDDNGSTKYFTTTYGIDTYSFISYLPYPNNEVMIEAVRHPGGSPEAVGRVAYTNDIPDVSGYATPEDVSAAADSAVATANAYTDGQTAPLWSYLGAENFRVVVTNYDSAVHPPVASFEYRMTTNEAFRTVWSETNGLNRAIATATNLAHQAAKKLVDDPANRAWGRYDSETGEASPEGVVQATAPGGLIVGGGQRWSQISAESGWWILTSTDPTLCRTGTNGVFSIIGSDGQEAVRIVKGGRVTVPAPADGISVSSGVCTVTYAVEAEQHPTARFAAELGGDAGDVWYSEDDADCPVTMTWSGTSGNYVLTFDTAGLSAGFVQATYEQGQESYTSFGGAGLELTKIRIGGKVYTVGTATIDGKTVLTLE